MIKLKEKITTLFSSKKKNVLRILILLFSLLLLLIIRPISNQIDFSIKGLLYRLGGEITPDSSIVIISISRDDIELLGGWPLRRSYYALLINELSSFRAKRIGLEVFLSSSNSLQDVYNEVLIEEINKSGNVVLSSITTTNGTGKDSLLLPQPKVKEPAIKTGHINYNSDSGVSIPSYYIFQGKHEYSFASELAQIKPDNENIEVNIFSSWKNFRVISVIELMKLAEAKSNQLSVLKDKYALIGITDLSLAKTIKTNFDAQMPGIGLHAFALDNILNRRTIKNEYSLPATLVLVFLLLLLFYPKSKIGFNFRYGIQLVAYLVVSVLLYRVFQIEVYHSFWILPLFLFFTSEWYFIFVDKKDELQSSFDENVYLKNLLISKENRLAKLEVEASRGEKYNKEELLKKISALKEEIEDLRKNDEAGTAHLIDMAEVRMFQGIVFRSEKIRKLAATIEKIAPYDATVLIQGESGSGKELVARAIHNLSLRKEKNFIAINCAAIPESLLESELFGHVKGAFTNAVGDKKGKFESANGGTLFLDEIGETSEAFQTKLLRAIQFGEFYKVGSTLSQKVDVRILAATNKNLEKAIKEKEFREDLFYRLNVLRLEIPPLRDRKEDIEILADYFCRREDDSIRLSKIVIESLNKNEWKGNVRELESVTVHSLIMAKAEGRKIIKLSDLPEEYKKYHKEEMEIIILDSMRTKEFSHSAMNETAKELGGLSRTMVSETLRGIFLKGFVENNFDSNKTVDDICKSGSELMIKKVKDKLSTYLENIENDLIKYPGKDFAEIKTSFASKYKNLPAKYHGYLDSVIQNRMKNMEK